jgi:hypothetical protein
MFDLSLLTRVAIHLSKRDCAIRLKEPITIGATGTCISTKKGMVIDILPTLSEEEFYKTFLHECGHARTQPFSESEIDYVNSPPRTLIYTKDWRENKLTQEAERQANELRDIWDSWAESWADLYSGANEYEKRLKALLNWAPGWKSMTEIINQAAKRGAEEALKIYMRS